MQALLFAFEVGFTALLALPSGSALAQNPPRPPAVSTLNDNKSNDGSDWFKRLGLKPGCYQVRKTITSSGLATSVTPEMYKAAMPNATPEQLAKKSAETNAQIAKDEKEAGRELSGISILCIDPSFQPPGPDQMFEMAKVEASLYLGDPRCDKTALLKDKVALMRVHCTDANGPGIAEQTAKFESLGPENFRNTVEKFARTDRLRSYTEINVGKWVGEAGPHMPHVPPVTGLDGVIPKGPNAVIALDKSRIVAMMNGVPFTAWLAFTTIYSIEPTSPKISDTELIDRMQELCLRYMVAAEAVRLHLDQQAPWKDRLKDIYGAAYYDAGDDLLNHNPFNPEFNATAKIADIYGGPTEQATKLLWQAFFSQEPTEAGKKALLLKMQQKYKLIVIDYDFFAKATKQ